MRRVLVFILLFSTPRAFAGFFEIGASANYRSSGYDQYNYIQSLMYTSSFSYYFWELCAVELNYTNGYSKQSTKGSDAISPKTTVEDNIEMISADLVLSFAARQDPFRPYIKLGGGYLTKERFRQVEGFDKERISRQNGVVPSGGVGLSINITKEFSIKFGIEAWTSPLSEDPVVVDYAGRAGVSWLL